MLRSKLRTMTCEVTASRETFTTSRAREGFWWTRVGSGPPAIVLVLDLVVWHLLLLGISVIWRVWNVVVVVQHGHGRLHLRGRRVAQAVHVLLGERWVGWELLLWLLR